MSNLHKRIKKHENMNIAEKERCNCDLCKGLNVDKNKRKVEIKNFEKKIDDMKSLPSIASDYVTI